MLPLTTTEVYASFLYYVKNILYGGGFILGVVNQGHHANVFVLKIRNAIVRLQQVLQSKQQNKSFISVLIEMLLDLVENMTWFR